MTGIQKMRAKKLLEKPTCWPDSKQGLLLRAIIFKDSRGVEAWKEWKKENFDNIDLGSLRLIPLLYRKLLDNGIHDPIMNRYRSVYRSFWARNQLLFNSFKPVLNEFYKSNIETILFKGMGLTLSLNTDIALRPMDDIDILINFKDVEKAVNIVEKLGWFCKFGYRCLINESINEITFGNGRGQFIDIHTHSLLHAMWGHHEMYYWERAMEIEFNNVPVKIMDSTSHLIILIVHGLSWNTIHPLRWISDSVLLLEKFSQNIEWDYLIEQSKRLRVSYNMMIGLKYLKEQFEAPIPENVLESLKNSKVPKVSTITFHLLTKPKFPRRINGMIIKALTYWAFRPKYPFPGIFIYFQKLWGLEHLWQVPINGVQKLFNNVVKNILEYLESRNKTDN